jgi:hypothetical protein
MLYRQLLGVDGGTFLALGASMREGEIQLSALGDAPP